MSSFGPLARKAKYSKIAGHYTPKQPIIDCKLHVITGDWLSMAFLRMPFR